MINFNFKNSGIKASELLAPAKKISAYITELKDASLAGLDIPEGFVNLVKDHTGIKTVKDMVAKKSPNKSNKFGAVAVIGMGASSSATKAVYDAVGADTPIIFFDNIDPDTVDCRTYILDKINGKVLVVPVSKSGTTLETLANFKVAISWLKKSDKQWRKNIVAVTNPDSALHKQCAKEGFDVLFSPPAISGRFSAFSATSILPLAAAGVDIDALISGAVSMTKKCLSSNTSTNPALQGASVIWLNNKKGMNICNNFIFSEKFEALAIFARNLLAESLGKEGNGITPIVSVGSTDLHSMGQLYFGGPKDKFTVFIGVEPDAKVVSGVNLGEVSVAIEKSVRRSYGEGHLPYYAIDFKEASAFSIGEFMAMKMFETVYLGRLMNVNVFDQPAVELYKKTARKILSN